MGNELATINNDNVTTGFISTVDTTTKMGKISLVNALNASTSLADLGDAKITVKDIVLNRGARSQTGEECINTHLILDDGSCVMSQSDGIARSALAIIDAWNGDFGNGIVVQIKSTKLSNGRTLKTIEVLDEI